jgi:hypothetical protein
MRPFAAGKPRRYGPAAFNLSESVPDIFDEIAEEVRAERFQRFLSRYSWLILVAFLVVVLGVAGWRLREWQLARADRAASVQYLMALNLADVPGSAGAKAREAATASLERLAATGPAGYRTLARLRAAALLAQDGKLPAALDLYNQVAADGAADPLLRDLATVLWAEHQIGTGNAQLVADRLKPLATPDSPWRPIVQRDLALLEMSENHPEAARKILLDLTADPTAPTGVRESAALLLDRLKG